MLSVQDVLDALVFGLTLAIVLGFGPAFITLIQTSILRGFRSAAWFAFGVFLNDVLMVSLCVLTSIRVVTDNPTQMLLFSFGAGIILILFGIFTCNKKVKEDNFKGIKERTNEIIDENREGFTYKDKTPKWFVFLGKGFVLNILNPFVWIFWFSSVAVTAGNMNGDKIRIMLFFAIVLGTSLSCDLLKAKGASFLKKFFNTKRIRIMNKVIGWGLVLFGLYFIGKGLISQHNSYETDSFTTKNGKSVTICALAHSSIRIEYDGKEIEIDPVCHLEKKTIDYAAQPKADYIFVTHEHFDHFDTLAIRQLTDENTCLITNQRCADLLGYGQVMANGDTLLLANDMFVVAVPAYNITPNRQQFHTKGRDNGFILSLDGLRIYLAGDTENIPEMEDIKDIDIAFLPCNQPYTMTIDQLVAASRTVKPKVLFPYHYGQTDVSGIPALLKDDGIDVRIRHYE